MDPVEASLEFVLSQLEPIEREEAQLRKRQEELAEFKAPLVEAVKDLKSRRKKKPKATRKASKPCARKPDIQAVCLALVEDNPSITKEDLFDLAKHKLIEELGFSPSGVALQLGKCLSSAMFAIGPDGSVAIATAIDSEPVDSGSIEEAESPVESSQERDIAG